MSVPVALPVRCHRLSFGGGNPPPPARGYSRKGFGNLAKLPRGISAALWSASVRWHDPVIRFGARRKRCMRQPWKAHLGAAWLKGCPGLSNQRRDRSELP